MICKRPVFFFFNFVANLRIVATKKNKNWKIRHILRKNKSDIATFKQWVPTRRQN
jgi:hypothetical protein